MFLRESIAANSLEGKFLFQLGQYTVSARRITLEEPGAKGVGPRSDTAPQAARWLACRVLGLTSGRLTSRCVATAAQQPPIRQPLRQLLRGWLLPQREQRR